VWVCGLRVISMDGSTTDVPDTDDNRAGFCGPGNDKRDGAFPQVRWVVAAESGTGALVEATIGAYTTGEQTLAKDLLSAFTAEMLVLADRNFLSHTAYLPPFEPLFSFGLGQRSRVGWAGGLVGVEPGCSGGEPPGLGWLTVVLEGVTRWA
jgi:hypothetical protein